MLSQWKAVGVVQISICAKRLFQLLLNFQIPVIPAPFFFKSLAEETVSADCELPLRNSGSNITLVCGISLWNNYLQALLYGKKLSRVEGTLAYPSFLGLTFHTFPFKTWRTVFSWQSHPPSRANVSSYNHFGSPWINSVKVRETTRA